MKAAETLTAWTPFVCCWNRPEAAPLTSRPGGPSPQVQSGQGDTRHRQWRLLFISRCAEAAPHLASTDQPRAGCQRNAAPQIGFRQLIVVRLNSGCDGQSRSCHIRDDGQIDLVWIVAGPRRTARVTSEASTRRSPS
jgi:hypothetical protein